VILLLACASPFDGAIVLTDANNYGYTSAIDIGSVDIPVGSDVAIDWSLLTADLLGDALDPAADITDLTLISFPDLSQEAVEAAVAADVLLQSDVGLLALLDTDGRTRAALSDFTVGLSTPLVPDQHVTDTSASWLLRATTGVLDTRMVTFVRPVTDGGSTTVTLGADSARLDFEVELSELTAVEVPASVAEDWTVEWPDVTVRGNGADFDPVGVDQLQLARLDEPIEDVEADFVHADQRADRLYTVSADAGTRVTLGDAVDAAGAPFLAFGSGELWMLALRCTTCANPAPPFVTLVRTAE
jgi:hypothetical protein